MSMNTTIEGAGLGASEHDASFAATQSRLYALLGMAVAFPDTELRDDIANGEVASALHETLIALGGVGTEAVDWDALADTGEGDALAIEYTRLFEVGTSGPPCPLYGGLYSGARMKVMEEAVRFYNHFGLGMSESEPRELPDHLSTELEFLHFLAYREAEAIGAGTDPDAYRRARRDFVERHPGRWIPGVRERLAQAQAGRYYAALFALLDVVLRHDARALRGIVGAPPPDGARGA